MGAEKLAYYGLRDSKLHLSFVKYTAPILYK